MEFKQLILEGLKVKQVYQTKNKNDQLQAWSASEYMQGFVGDVGDLAKLIMANNNFRQIDNVNDKLAHELSDCLWSLIVIADELDINLELAFLKTMTELQQKLAEQSGLT